MAHSAANYIGIEIGGTKLQIVAGDSRGHIARRWRAIVDLNRGGPGICDQLLQGLGEIMPAAHARGIGVGFGGPVDWKTGRIAVSHQVEGWEDFELGKWLSEHARLPVRIENDSNLAALAEATRGAGAGFDPVFYFNMGSGVGGGIVINGRVYHGAPPGEAEFGHVRLDRSGATVESRCSGWAIDRRIRAIASANPASFFGRAAAGINGGEARHFAAALAKDDPDARQILAELSGDLAFALSHVIHLLHPAVIVMGGGLSLVGEPLRKAIADALPTHVMEVFAPGPPLRLAEVGEDAVPVGALLLAATGESC